MADNMYGYQDDDRSTNFSFGLNANRTFLKKFEFNPNGGKDGAAQEALDIVFEINGGEKFYRQFPVTKAFDDDNNTITDPNHPAMLEAIKNLGSILTHIIGCFVEKDAIKSALNRPIASFRQYCEILTSLLPADFSSKPLDIFMHWQWKIRGEQTRTFLEIPKNMKQGKWLVPSYHHKGAWEEKKVLKPTEKTKEALYYVDSEDETNIHPFTRSGWFMLSAYGSQQTEDNAAAHAVLGSVAVKDDELPFKQGDTPPKKTNWI
jgi:hypothetical protein